MACGCGGGKVANSNFGGDTLGYRAVLPGGIVVPPREEVPYFMAAEALREVTAARGGSVRRIRKGDQDDAYALAKAARAAATA